MDNNLMQLGISLASGLVCLLPLALQETNFENSSLRPGLSSKLYRDSAIMIIAFVIPIALDTLADITNYSKQKPPKGQERGTLLSVNERILFLFGIAICPATAYLPDETPNLAYIYFCCNKSQLVITFGVIVTSLCRCKKEFWSVRSTYIQLIIMCAGQICSAFLMNIYATDPTERRIFTAIWIIWGSFLSAAVIFFSCLGRWLFVDMYPRMKIFCSISSDKKVKVPVNFLFPLIMSMIAATFFSLLVYLLFHHGSVYMWDKNALFLNNLAFILLLIVYYFVMIRMVKYEVVQGLYALIDSKMSYVRYISHELRTPLNAAFLGLKLLMDDIESSSDPKDVDRYSTLCDVNLSCRTAVDILNDLLCFDKIESGVLELHKHDVSLLPFIKDCVGMFSTQAREGGVNLSIVSCTDEEHHIHHKELPLHSPLRESDTVFMDKFKMDQVLRNLVSNALKFTPRGGSVSVSAVFVPDKVDSERIKPIKSSSFSFMMRFTESSRVHDCVQDLEAAIRPENCISYNHIDETHNNSTVENENVMDHGKLLIVVRDSGVGISKENQKRLFHEVVQFNPEVLQAGGGSGLGLWITNNIVNMHDGKVSVYSAGDNSGSGCSFSVEVAMQRKTSKFQSSDPTPIEIDRTLQASQAVQALQCDSKEEDTVEMGIEIGLGGMNRPTRSLSVASTREFDGSSIGSLSRIKDGLPFPRNQYFKTIQQKQPSFSSFSTKILVGKNIPLPTNIIYNILMVDDSGLNRKLLGKLLRSSGHIVVEAEDGVQAVEMVKTRIETDKEYDIILMDFVMPKMDGPSATKAIRALGYTSPIFGVTGNAIDSDIDHFLGHGADRVMIKPFNLQLFNQNMTDIIATRSTLTSFV